MHIVDSVKKLIRAFLTRAGGRYIIIGGSVYLLELVIIIIAQDFGANAVVAVSLSFWTGLVISFVLQKFITFGDKRTHHRVLLPQIIATGLLVMFNFGFTLLVTKLLADVLPAIVIRTLALAVTTIWNFYLYKKHIFKLDRNDVY